MKEELDDLFLKCNIRASKVDSVATMARDQ